MAGDPYGDWDAKRAAKTAPAPALSQPYAGETSAYAAAALKGECDAVRATQEGARNDRLNVAALKLGQLIAGGELDRNTVEDELYLAGTDAGLGGKETRQTIRSGIEAGLKQPRRSPPRTEPPRAEQNGRSAGEPWTDPTTTPKPPKETGANGTRLVLTPASTIKPRPVWWVWKNRLALGTIGLLAGREGLGKSTVAYTLAAYMTRGRLKGHYHGTAKAVLVCATEDSWEHTIVPRLLAADADLDLVYRVEAIDADEVHVGLSLPRDLRDLERSAVEVGAALLILDPLMSRLGKLDTHRDAEVRQALEPLAAIADRTAMAILGLIHHNKGGSTDPLDLVMGSKAFTAVARSVHTVIPDPDDETGIRRLFGTPKNNLGKIDLPTFTFMIESHSVTTEEGPAETGKLVWGSEIADTIGDAIRRAAATGEEKSALQDACEWLREYLTLAGGEDWSQNTISAGQKAGHSKATIERARVKIRVVVERRSRFPNAPTQTVWTLDAMGGG